MDFADIFKLLTPAAIGAVLGYLGKTLIEHFLRLRSHKADTLVNLQAEKAKRLDERIAYQSERFFLPFARSLEKLASRLLIVVGEKGDIASYTDAYIEDTAIYELCAACYWVERQEADPRLVDVLDAQTLARIREALRAVSPVPSEPFHARARVAGARGSSG